MNLRIKTTLMTLLVLSTFSGYGFSGESETKYFAFTYLECTPPYPDDAKIFPVYLSKVFLPTDISTYNDHMKGSVYTKQIEQQGAQQLGASVVCRLNKGARWVDEQHLIKHLNETHYARGPLAIERKSSERFDYFTLQSSFIKYDLEID